MTSTRKTPTAEQKARRAAVNARSRAIQEAKLKPPPSGIFGHGSAEPPKRPKPEPPKRRKRGR